jgi:hypothetical protein
LQHAPQRFEVLLLKFEIRVSQISFLLLCQREFGELFEWDRAKLKDLNLPAPAAP